MACLTVPSGYHSPLAPEPEGAGAHSLGKCDDRLRSAEIRR